MNTELLVFSQKGHFAAAREAEQWCKKNGISVGAIQGSKPRGLLYGRHDIRKWGEYAEHHFFDGIMTGNMRKGPVTIELTK
jgi:hypothetical protein